jgi:hypothetical protein
MDIRDRIEHLESENRKIRAQLAAQRRWLKVGLSGCLTLLGLTLLAGARSAAPPVLTADQVTAKRFDLLDKDGKEATWRLYANDEGPRMEFWGRVRAGEKEELTELLRIQAAKDGASEISMLDERGRRVAGMGRLKPFNAAFTVLEVGDHHLRLSVTKDAANMDKK